MKNNRVEQNIFLHKHFWKLCAFFLPFVICTMICMVQEVFPFGQNCILHVDMYHQYCPYFSEFARKLKNGSSLMYTWNEGLGTDFWSLYVYYLASPLNWLLILWPQKYVIEFMTLTILIKIGLSGFFCFLFFEYHFQLQKNMEQLLALALSLAYALSGFVAAYSWDIMWMDVIALTPLVVMGLERLVKENQVGLYFVALTLSIWSNYYMAMMLCMFLVFYFIYLQIQEDAINVKSYIRFGLYSILSGGACAVLLIPESIVLSYSGSSGFRFPSKLEWYFSLWDELARLNFMAESYMGGEHYPNLYVGCFTIVLVFFYVCNKNISLKRKIPALVMVLFFGVSFANNYLDFIWHGLHFPDSLPGRQAYLFAFLLLTIAFAQIKQWDGVTVPKFVGIGSCLLLVMVVGYQFSNKEITDSFSYFMSGIFLACFLVFALLYELVDQKTKLPVICFVVLLVIVETTANMAYTGFSVTSRTAYMEKYDDYEKMLASAKDENANVFYRVEDPQRMTKNDCSLYGYASATEFSSLMNINISHLYQSLYMEGGKNFYCYNGTTPLTAAMLSVKYFLYDNNLESYAFREMVKAQGDQFMYENKYCLPLGYMVSDDIKNCLEGMGKDKIANNNILARKLNASEDLLQKTTCIEQVEAGSTTITIEQSGFYYVHYLNCDSDILRMKTSDGRTRKYSKTTHDYLMEIGQMSESGEITITNANDEEIHFEVYKLNETALQQAYDTLNQNTMKLIKQQDTCIEGMIDVTEEKNLILSIPCEAGWSLYVDGKQTEPESLADAWISVPLQKGEHVIKLEYKTPGFTKGAAISLLSVGICMLCMLYRKKRRKL